MPGPFIEKPSDAGETLHVEMLRRGVIAYDEGGSSWAALVPRGPVYFRDLQIEGELSGQLYPGSLPKWLDPQAVWIGTVQTRLRSALFATKQGWDWEWDRPGVYTRPGAHIDDVITGMELVMRLLGIHPYDLTADAAILVGVDQPIPYTPTPAADVLGLEQ